MKVKDIINIMNNFAPPYLIDKWDNTGFQLGNPDEDVKNILLSLDLSDSVIELAIEKNANMIITHHPLVFKPISTITFDSYKGKMIYKLIKNNISVLSAHSNLDVCNGGVNDVLADKLNIIDKEILSKSYTENLFKIAVFVPKSYIEQVRDAMTKANAGWVGNYKDCTFNVDGIGTFTPLEGTNPFIGQYNKIEQVEETRLETIVKEKDLKNVISSMISAHPYEEVAYDVYKLENNFLTYGYGRIGRLDNAMTLEEFSDKVKKTLGCSAIRIYGDLTRKISRVAVCGGSGGEFIKSVYRENGDVYVTGDIKHHEAQMALELGIALIDAGHYDTEKVILYKLKEYIKDKTNGFIDILVNEKNEIPFLIF